jgi:hypothetical protein
MGLDSHPEYCMPRAVLGLSWNSIVLVLILVAVGIRLFGVGNKQLWVDELIQVINSSPDSIGDVLKGVAQDKGGAPVDYIVQHYVLKLFRGQCTPIGPEKQMGKPFAMDGIPCHSC